MVNMNQLLPILIVEHHSEERSKMSDSFSSLQIGNPLVFVSDSDAAFTYLEELSLSPFKRKRLPGLIFLDLQSEHNTSLNLLEGIKKDPAYCQVPVVVLSNSTDANDIETCYSLGCNGYFQKPQAEQSYNELIRLVHDFWFNSVSVSNMKEFVS